MNWGSEIRVALLDVRFERARRFEGLGFPSKPLRKDERSDDGQGDVWTHPELGAASSLARGVARRKEEGELSKSIGDECGEAGTDQPAKLFVIGVGDQSIAGD